MTTIDRPLRRGRAAAAGSRKLRTALAALGDAVRDVPFADAHLVIGPAGIFAVAARRFKPAGPVDILSDSDGSRLLIGGRDRTAAVAALPVQLPGIRTALLSSVEFRATPIMPALAVVGRALERDDAELDGVRIRDLDGLIALVTTTGPLDHAARERLARLLAGQRPA